MSDDFDPSEYLKNHPFHRDYYTSNKPLLDFAKKCGCFFCLKEFDASLITEWAKDINGPTAICPFCNIDSVVPNLGQKNFSELLLKARKYAFE